jgi:Mrp family chromosome partitioning ATPase
MPLHEASAEVWLSQPSLAASLIGVADQSATSQPERLATTQARLARVPEVARRTLAAAGVHDRSARDFLKQSDVRAASDADLLEFTVRDPESKLAIRLSTEYAKQFIAYRAELDSTALARTRNGIRQQLDRLRAAGATRSPLYADLTAKDQQLIAIESLNATSAQLVRPADTAPQISPRIARSGVFGVALGIVLGIGLVLLMEALDTRVRTAEEIEQRLGLPLLARLPYPSRDDQNPGKTEMLNNAAGPYAESIRSLRVRLGFSRPPSPSRVLMVSSATPGEGKSTTGANLAIALAQAGRSVVLCDLDARRPVINRFFGLQASPGLIDVAVGHIQLERALNVVAIPNQDYWSQNGDSPLDSRGSLEVLTFGRPPPDPGEFVGSDRVVEILKELRARAEIVLVDAPALLGVGDAMTLSGEVDGLLIVTRLDFIRRSTLGELRRVIASSLAPSLGFVVTGSSTADGYRYGYDGDYPPTPPSRVERGLVGQ